jgi:hypothetical protein
VLRLLPDCLRIGLFGADSWILSRDGETLGRLSSAALHTKDGLLGLLDAMLREHKTKARNGSFVDVVTSDALFSIIMFPWHDSLATTDELTNYARLKISDSTNRRSPDLCVHVIQRHFGEAGIAYSIPQSLLIEISDIVSQNGFLLRRITPLSAVMHSKCSAGLHRNSVLTFAIDGQRATAHLYKNRRLVCYEAEPMVSELQGVLKRLFARTLRQNNIPNVVQLWFARDEDICRDFTKQYFSEDNDTPIFTPIARRKIV